MHIDEPQGPREPVGSRERWRKSPLSAVTRQQWNAFKAYLRQTCYDAVIHITPHIHIHIHIHAVQHSRELAARALDYTLPPRPEFGSAECSGPLPQNWRHRACGRQYAKLLG
jgi:hypothetical protein